MEGISFRTSPGFISQFHLVRRFHGSSRIHRRSIVPFNFRAGKLCATSGTSDRARRRQPNDSSRSCGGRMRMRRGERVRHDEMIFYFHIFFSLYDQSEMAGLSAARAKRRSLGYPLVRDLRGINGSHRRIRPRFVYDGRIRLRSGREEHAASRAGSHSHSFRTSGSHSSRDSRDRR